VAAELGIPRSIAMGWLCDSVWLPSTLRSTIRLLPHSALRGQTPDKMYYGRGDQVPRELEQARLAARRARLEANRGLHCAVCPQGEPRAAIGNSEAA
jgi:hypothetical protein